MNNSEIELELMLKFGLDKVVIFAEMASVMYDMLYKDVQSRNIDDVCEYDYERNWWKKKHIELKKRQKSYLT